MAENIFERNARINGGVNLEELQAQVDELANPTRDDIALAYGLEVPVESSGVANFIGFFF